MFRVTGAHPLLIRLPIEVEPETRVALRPVVRPLAAALAAPLRHPTQPLHLGTPRADRFRHMRRHQPVRALGEVRVHGVQRLIRGPVATTGGLGPGGQRRFTGVAVVVGHDRRQQVRNLFDRHHWESPPPVSCNWGSLSKSRSPPFWLAARARSSNPRTVSSCVGLRNQPPKPVRCCCCSCIAFNRSWSYFSLSVGIDRMLPRQNVSFWHQSIALWTWSSVQPSLSSSSRAASRHFFVIVGLRQPLATIRSARCWHRRSTSSRPSFRSCFEVSDSASVAESPTREGFPG